jgi:uncharacterized LabA/DUF88 family protein
MKIACIDGAGLYFCTKSIGFDVDYLKLHSWLQQQGVGEVHYYMAEDDYPSVTPLVIWLQNNGYNVVALTPTTQYARTQRTCSGIDIKIAIDVLTRADLPQELFLFSGDGTYVPLIDALKARGSRVTVVHSLINHAHSVAMELHRAADTFVDLVLIRGQIER